ncbi:uncharacterized protein [Mytilus edulis]|uniref:uncharacterized protein n=1 Tax=Mytilus edulis TaxID=6550 RepID=UPI0039F0933B
MNCFIVSLLFYITCTIPVIASNSPETLEFTCSNDGNIKNITASKLSEFVVLDGYNSCLLNNPSCGKDKSELHVVHVKTFNKQRASIIIGGKDAQFYDLKCKPKEFVGRATANFKIAPSSAIFITEAHTFSPNETAIDLTVEKGTGGHVTDPVNLGETLSLKFKGPVGYIVDPINCTAYPGLEQSSTSRDLWSNKNCSSLDTAILDKSWKSDGVKHNIISITMYAFRFSESTNVEIECTAHFCPESDTKCPKKCWKSNSDTIGRRRRGAIMNSHGKNHYMKKVSTFFTVVDDSGTSNRSSETPSMNTFLYLATIAIILGYFV